MAKKYRIEACISIHETIGALHEVDAINKQTMREFDDACLPPAHPWHLSASVHCANVNTCHSPSLPPTSMSARIWSLIGSAASRSLVAPPYAY